MIGLIAPALAVPARLPAPDRVCRLRAGWSQGCSIGCDFCLTDPKHPANGGKIPTTPITGNKTSGGHSDKAGFRVSYCEKPKTQSVLPKEYWTMNVHAIDGAVNDSYRFNPWRAPGSAPVVDPSVPFAILKLLTMERSSLTGFVIPGAARPVASEYASNPPSHVRVVPRHILTDCLWLQVQADARRRRLYLQHSQRLRAHGRDGRPRLHGAAADRTQRSDHLEGRLHSTCRLGNAFQSWRGLPVRKCLLSVIYALAHVSRSDHT